jgi:hypothetical protein
VGLSSYHFVADDEGSNKTVRLQFVQASKDVSHRGPLVNRMPIPSRGHFRNIMYPAPNVFSGHTGYRTTEQEYEMHFGTEFMCILLETLHNVSLHDDDTPTEMSSFGDSLLVYCNTALSEDVRRCCNTEH